MTARAGSGQTPEAAWSQAEQIRPMPDGVGRSRIRRIAMECQVEASCGGGAAGRQAVRGSRADGAALAASDGRWRPLTITGSSRALHKSQGLRPGGCHEEALAGSGDCERSTRIDLDGSIGRHRSGGAGNRSGLAEAASRVISKQGTFTPGGELIARSRPTMRWAFCNRLLPRTRTRRGAPALDTQGHLLVRFGRRADAMPVFADLLVRTAKRPDARIVRRAKARLGALCRTTSGRITDAEKVFADSPPRVTTRPSLLARTRVDRIDYERLRNRLAESKTVDHPAGPRCGKGPGTGRETLVQPGSASAPSW